MNVLHRLFVCAALCGWVACSESGIDSSEPAPAGEQLRTVVIGCGGIGIDTRTYIEKEPVDGHLGVRWVPGDCIRLWARESATGTPVLEDTPFEFDYYSPVWSRAAFTGLVNEGDLSRFKSEQKYDYFAVSPAPASVEGTSATFDIPAVQSGEFNCGLDIMTAQLTGAPALEAGDTNWANGFCLPFEHHVHVLKITITDNLLKSPKSNGETEEQVAEIRSIELTFPKDKPVVGRLKVDAATGEAQLEGGGNVLTLRFDTPKHTGDVVYAFIAPQESFPASDKITIKAAGASAPEKPSSVSVERSFTKPEGKFACGAVTPVNYNIPERYRCTKIVFSLGEKEGGEEPDREDSDRKIIPADIVAQGKGYGWGTLGEEIKSFSIVDKATGAKLTWTENNVEKPLEFTCTDHTKNRYEISCTDEGADAHTDFLNQYAGKACIAKLTSEHAEVECAFTFPPLAELTAEVENPVPALNVPYLFEEDFRGLTGSFHYDDDGKIGGHTWDTDTGSNEAKLLENYNNSGMPAGWYGARCGGEKGVVRICARLEYISSTHGTYHGRIDAPNLSNIKSPVEKIKIAFKYSIARTVHREEYDRQPYLAVGVTNDTNKNASGAAWPGDDLLKPCISGVVKKDLDASSDRTGLFTSVNHPMEFITPDIEDKDKWYTSDYRLVWEVYTKEHEGGSPVKYNTSNNYVYLDDIKVSIAH